MNATVQNSKLRASLWRLFAGAVVGAVGAALFFALLGERYLDLDDPVVMLAAGAGLVYALMGLSVAFGIIAPRTGARFLNVEDAEELREERPKLRPAAAACVLIGLFLLVLALAASGTSISREALLAIAAFCLAGTVALTVVSRKRTDELTRQVSLEASSFTLHTALIALAAWAALAQLGYVAWISPLVAIAGLALLQLVSIFAVAAARGMLLR